MIMIVKDAMMYVLCYAYKNIFNYVNEVITYNELNGQNS